jgi:TonB family protein
MAMTIRQTCSAVAALLLASCMGVLVAQTPSQTQTQAPAQTTREIQLLQRTAQSPNDVNALLDLARIYVDQRRYEEASRILQRAVAAVQHEALVNVGTGTTAATNEPVYRVGGQIAEPKRIKYVDPVYPPEAQRAKLQGYVILEAVIGTDGTVRDVKVIKSTALLDQAALDAVKQWRYEPSTVNGTPVQVTMSMTVIFSLK